jgi:hypothetical protein
VLAFILCRGICLAAPREEGQGISSSYVIRSLGTNIGTVKARMSGTATDNDFRADADVRVNLWFFGFSLTSSETTSIRAGRMVRYRKTIDTGGHRREITGEVAGGTLIMLVQDGGKVERTSIPLGDYDITNMEYPEVALVPGETRQMRVMDLENAEVVERQYRYVKEEKTEIEGREAKVIVADFSDKNAECRRWTAVINGLPIVIRQDGKEKTGFFNPSYSVRQTSKTDR